MYINTNEDSYEVRFAIALAFAAYRANGCYVKQTSSVNGELIYSNKESMYYTLAQMRNTLYSIQKNWIPENFVALVVTDEDHEEADQAIKFFKRYILDAMTDNFSNFKRDILNVVSEDYVPAHKLGIVGYIPELYNRENQDVQLRRRIKKEFADSEYFTGKIAGTIEILKCIRLAKFEKYAHLGVVDGNLVSFMSVRRFDIGQKYQITAKFASKDVCDLSGFSKSRINYVKMKKA
jgi:hypothetical protein